MNQIASEMQQRLWVLEAEERNRDVVQESVLETAVVLSIPTWCNDQVERETNLAAWVRLAAAAIWNDPEMFAIRCPDIETIESYLAALGYQPQFHPVMSGMDCCTHAVITELRVRENSRGVLDIFIRNLVDRRRVLLRGRPGATGPTPPAAWQPVVAVEGPLRWLASCPIENFRAAVPTDVSRTLLRRLGRLIYGRDNGDCRMMIIEGPLEPPDDPTPERWLTETADALGEFLRPMGIRAILLEGHQDVSSPEGLSRAFAARDQIIHTLTDALPEFAWAGGLRESVQPTAGSPS